MVWYSTLKHCIFGNAIEYLSFGVEAFSKVPLFMPIESFNVNIKNLVIVMLSKVPLPLASASSIRLPF